jgi:hypothetical protein
MIRSMAAVASGLPAPRYATVDVEFVTTEKLEHSAFGILYGPEVMTRVINGSTAPKAG